MTGLEVIAAVGPARMPATVFVTAYEQYAVRAFEANAVDYLVKPFSKNDLVPAIEVARGRFAEMAALDGEVRTLQEPLTP